MKSRQESSRRQNQWGQIPAKSLLPALVSGITVTAIALIGSTAVAGVIGAGGLGNLAYLIGYTRNKVDIIFVATVAILILVFIIQIIGDRATKAIDKR